MSCDRGFTCDADEEPPYSIGVATHSSDPTMGVKLDEAVGRSDSSGAAAEWEALPCSPHCPCWNQFDTDGPGSWCGQPWVTLEEVPKPSWCKRRPQFYWNAVFHNKMYKEMYIGLRQELCTIRLMLTSLTQMGFETAWDEENTEYQLEEKNTAHINTELLLCLKGLNHVFRTYYEFMWLCGCPMHLVYRAYFPESELSSFDKLQFKGTPGAWVLTCGFRGPMEEYSPAQELRMKSVFCFSILSRLEACLDIISSQVDRNDELVFKIFLFVINILTFIGQYIWNAYINPERVYTCTT